MAREGGVKNRIAELINPTSCLRAPGSGERIPNITVARKNFGKERMPLQIKAKPSGKAELGWRCKTTKGTAGSRVHVIEVVHAINSF